MPSLDGLLIVVAAGFAALRGRLLRLTVRGYALSLAVAVAVSLALGAVGLVQTPLLVAIALGSTSLGVLIPC